MHSVNVPNISINYSEDTNNNFTASDEYNGYVALTEVNYSADTEFVVPAGVTKIEYSAGDSGARIAEVEAGDILEYTADPNDSTKFTLTVYDKDKNKKRDLYTWNNDNLHLSYGTSKSYNNKDSESSYEDVSYSLPDAAYVDFISSGQTWEVPTGVDKIKIQQCSASSAFPAYYTYDSIGKVVEVPDDTTVMTFRQYYGTGYNYGILDSNRKVEFYKSTGNRKYKYKLRVHYGKLINEMGVE